MYNTKTIKDLREDLGLSQTEVTDRCGIEKSHLSKIENGLSTPRPGTMKKLAEAYNVERSEIVKAIAVTHGQTETSSAVVEEGAA